MARGARLAMWSCSPCCAETGNGEDMPTIHVEDSARAVPVTFDENLKYVLTPNDPEPADALVIKPSPETALQRAEARETHLTYEVVCTEKRAGGLGLDLSPHDGATLLIGKVKHGPMLDWNEEHGAEVLVQRGDRIVAVNGVSGNSEELLEHLRRDRALTITMRRLLDFSVNVVRLQSESLGIFLEDAGATMRVTRLVSGPVADANKRNGVELEVRPGDEIYEANGVAGSGAQIFEALRKATAVTLRIRRPQQPRESAPA